MTQKIDSEWKERQENLLIALDQLEQITEVMSDVLSRVKKQVNALEEQAQVPSTTGKVNAKKLKARPTTKTKKVDLVH